MESTFQYSIIKNLICFLIFRVYLAKREDESLCALKFLCDNPLYLQEWNIVADFDKYVICILLQTIYICYKGKKLTLNILLDTTG